MRVDIKTDSFFVNLPSKLYNKIEELASQRDDIDLGLLALSLHLILTQKFKDKNKESGDEWISLCSEILRGYDYKDYSMSKHLDFLVNHNILESRTHISYKNAENNRCKQFKLRNINEEENSLKIAIYDETKEYRVSNNALTKKINKSIKQRLAEAEYKSPHLTKCLNKSGFTIEREKAMEYINDKFPAPDNKLMEDEDSGKRLKREVAVNMIGTINQSYSREGKDDRLHSYFTSLPSDLKQFIRFNGERFKEADVKSAQPFILTVILSIIKEEYQAELKKFNKITTKRFSKKLCKRLSKYINNDNEYKIDIMRICYNITIMLQESLKPFDFTEIDRFIFLVRSGDIYTHIAKHLLEKNVITEDNGVFYVKLFDKDKRYIEVKEFESLRECGKKITINALYSSNKKSGVKAIEEFKEFFPIVNRILGIVKSNDKSDSPILMQRIEAKCILDYCSKKIAKKYPNMLLITRHDSISTTESNFKILKKEFQQLLNKYFGGQVELGEEAW